jgi:TonB family protein
MQTSRLRVFVFTCVLLAGAVCSASTEDSVSAEALVARARKLHEVWTAGTPPVTMRAEIQVSDATGGVTQAQYIVNWVSPARWREEIRFTDYDRIRVHNAKGYWQKSRLNFQPRIILQLDGLLDFKSDLKIRAKEVPGKVKTRDKDGMRQSCMEVKSKTGIVKILCLDDATGNLLSVDYPKHNEYSPDISRIEYRAFRNVGEKRVPFEIRAFSDKLVVATVRVVEMTPMVQEDPSLFVAPTNSEFWTQCEDMQEAELVGRVQPQYPLTSRAKREEGMVMFYAVIETDGTLSHLALIQRLSPTLDSAAADAIRQWHYKPAACDSTPIRVETAIAVYFSLRYN